MQCSKSNSPGLKTGVKRDFFFHFRIIRDWGQETIKWGERSRVEDILSKSNEVMVASAAMFPKGFAVSVTVSVPLNLAPWPLQLHATACSTRHPTKPLSAAPGPAASLWQNTAEQNGIYVARRLVCCAGVQGAGCAWLLVLSAGSSRSSRGTVELSWV